MFGEAQDSVTCGFAFCLPVEDSEASHSYFVMAFLFVWFSGWNFGCSTFVFVALARLRQKCSVSGWVQLLVSLLIPHVAIGLVLPFFVGGIYWQFVAIWPYYYRLYHLAKMPVDRGSDHTGAAPPATHDSAIVTVIRMHTPDTLRRGMSNPAVLVQPVPATPAPVDGKIPVVMATVVGTDGASQTPGNGATLAEIHVRTGALVDGVRFVFSDGSSRVFGSSTGGSERQALVMNDGEHLAKVTACVGASTDGIQFETSAGRRSDWYGGRGGTPFSWTTSNGFAIIGFQTQPGALTSKMTGILQAPIPEESNEVEESNDVEDNHIV